MTPSQCGEGVRRTPHLEMVRVNFRFCGWSNGQTPSQKKSEVVYFALSPKMLIFDFFEKFYMWKTQKHLNMLKKRGEKDNFAEGGWESRWDGMPSPPRLDSPDPQPSRSGRPQTVLAAIIICWQTRAWKGDVVKLSSQQCTAEHGKSFHDAIHCLAKQSRRLKWPR